jgi:tRNA(Ile)-lysidine synthase TilS/MesJ
MVDRPLKEDRMTDQPTNLPASNPEMAKEKETGRARWKRMVEDLERERDELRVRLHLAKAEARDEFAELESRIADLKARGTAARGEAGEALEDVEEAAKHLWAEIKGGLARVRKSLAD